MSACDTIRPELVAYVDGEVDAPARAAVDAHLASCAACRREVTLLAATGKLMDRYVVPDGPAAGFEARLRERIRREGSGEGAARPPADPAAPAARPFLSAPRSSSGDPPRSLFRRYAAPFAVAAALLVGVVGIAARLGLLDPVIEIVSPGTPEIAERDPVRPPKPAPAPAPRVEPEPLAPGRAPAPAPAATEPGAAATPTEPGPGPIQAAPAAAPEPAAPAIPQPAEPDIEGEVIAALDVLENLDLLENLELLELYDAPDDPTQALEEERG